MRGGSGPDRSGVSFLKGSTGTLWDSLIEDCAFGFDYAHAGGIEISNTTIRRNGTGLSAGQAGASKLTNDVISDNLGNGIATQARVELTRTLVIRNGGYGVHVSFAGFQARESRITQNRLGGVWLGRGGLAETSLTDNTISDNGGHGIDVFGDGSTDDTQAKIVGNTVDHNVSDGIHVDSHVATVSGNHTWFNGNLGVEAVPGTSGGANWAKHNGNPLQCVPTTLCTTTGKPKG